MTDTAVTTLVTHMMIAGATLAAPALLTALFVGFGVSLLQALTQVQDSTLSFVPKILAVGIALLVSGNWMLHEMVSFTQQVFASLPALLGGG
jgi:flagellar biosynthetic protein FliQ